MKEGIPRKTLDNGQMEGGKTYYRINICDLFSLAWYS